jgi:PAS domain S-box-containing protein
MNDSGENCSEPDTFNERDVNRLATICEFSEDAILGMTLEGIITDWNHGASELYGYSADEAMGRSVSFLLLSSHFGELDHILDTIRKGGRIKHFDTVRVRKDGSPVEVSLTASPIKDHSEQLTGVSWIARDITSRKAMERALRESEEKFRVLMETASAVILLHQGDNYIYANPATEHATGYSKDELYQMKFWELVAPEYRDVVRARGAARLRGENPEQRYEVKIVTKQWDQRWWDLASSNLDYRGKPSILVTGLDNTDRKQTEKALEDARSQAELYVDILSHDIGNMNQAMMGYLEMALELNAGNEGIRELIERPMEIIQNSASLINNVRKLKRLQADVTPLIATDLDKVLLAVCSKQIRDSPRSIEVRYRPSRPSLIMANDQLEDIFSSLVENAIKHSSGALVIDIKLIEAWQANKKYYRVDVENNGPGIPDSEKVKLLADIRDDQARKRGIGMQIIKSLVKKFCGQIALEDRVQGDPSKGVRFTVVFPAFEK